ncbi:MAG: hypothetical protein JXA00_00105 [Candidatus Thermoplasmatota archaeon]|nr:hypothetical protein [Candidatus Thermoplasmatota archaeon]
MEEEICCPKFNPTPWDRKLFEWKEKKFIKDRVGTFMYMPLNFGGVMKRLDEQVRSAQATIPSNLCLSDHTSKWNMDVYCAVDKDIPGANNITLSGKFLCKVYEGPFQDTGKWSEDFKAYATNEGVSIKKWFMWYTTCPKCAKKYGKNYVVIIAQVS